MSKIEEFSSHVTTEEILQIHLDAWEDSERSAEYTYAIPHFLDALFRLNLKILEELQKINK